MIGAVPEISQVEIGSAGNQSGPSGLRRPHCSVITPCLPLLLLWLRSEVWSSDSKPWLHIKIAWTALNNIDGGPGPGESDLIMMCVGVAGTGVRRFCNSPCDSDVQPGSRAAR